MKIFSNSKTLLIAFLFHGLCGSWSKASDLSSWISQAQSTTGNVTASSNGGGGWSFSGGTGVAYDFGALDSLDGKAVDGATVEFIFNFSDSSSTMAIATVGGRSPVNQNNVFKLEQWSNTGKFGITLPGRADYSFNQDSLFGQDIHVVFRRNSSGTMDLFINGIFIETHTEKTNWRLDGGGGFIGSAANGTGDVPTGQMYGVASYDAALSNQEILDLYYAYNGPPADPHVVVSPDSLDYGDYEPSSGVLGLDVSINNHGASQNLTISNVEVTGADASLFSVGSFPASIAPQGTANVTITFDPSAAVGIISATLEIETNGGNQASVQVPLRAFAFEPLPDKAAVLIINPHPDDEGLFYGGSMSYYSKIRNLPTVLMSMTSGDSGISVSDPADRFLREDEMNEAAKIYGIKYKPIYPRFDDGGSSVGTVNTWTQFPTTGDDGADYLSPFTGNPVEYTARVIRQLRPEVLLTSDSGGDYGHADHVHTSAAVVAAYDMAADAGVTILDEEGSPLPPWTVTKFYVHDADFDDANHLGHLFHEHWETNYEELGGLTPRLVTGLGLVAHASQAVPREARSYFGDQYWGSQYEPSELWTMLKSSVGLDSFNVGTLSFDPNFNSHPDIHHGDFLENIDLTLFAQHLADADGSGTVDGDDLAIMLSKQGQTVPHGSVANGDANGDGLVSQADLNILHLANADTDTDGLPDAWELAHFPSLVAAQPGADEDGDGLDTLSEFVAGLNPSLTDKLSLSISASPQTVNFMVPAASGAGYNGLVRRYELRFSPDLSDWSAILSQGVGDGTPRTEPIPEEQAKGFYRLELSVE